MARSPISIQRCNIANPRFNPTFKIGNTTVVLHPLETVSVATENLGKPVGSLAREADRIIGAMDELLLRLGVGSLTRQLLMLNLFVVTTPKNYSCEEYGVGCTNIAADIELVAGLAALLSGLVLAIRL
jgi:hypothetical protein